MSYTSITFIILRYHDKLLLMLLRGIERPVERHPERAWLVMKLMSAVRRLGKESWQKITSVLQGALGMLDTNNKSGGRVAGLPVGYIKNELRRGYHEWKDS